MGYDDHGSVDVTESEWLGLGDLVVFAVIVAGVIWLAVTIIMEKLR